MTEPLIEPSATHSLASVLRDLQDESAKDVKISIVDDVDVAQLADGLANARNSVSGLSLIRTLLDDNALTRLAKALTNHHQLKHLRFEKFFASPETFRRLIKVFVRFAFILATAF